MRKGCIVLITSCLVSILMFLVACAPSTPAPAPAPSTSAPSVAPATSATPSPTASAKPSATASTAPAGGKVWKLKFSHEQPSTAYYHIYGHAPWAEAVTKATNGRVQIEIYPSQSLLKTQDAYQGVQTGIVDIAWMHTGLFPGVFELIEALTLPYTLVSKAEVDAHVAWQLYSKFPEIQKQFASVHMLSVWASEPQYYVSTKKNYKTADDFKGIKIRATGGPPTDTLKNLGASPLLLGMPDVYLNLQKGVMEAAMVSSESYGSYRLYEVAPYATFVPANSVVHMITMNKDLWDSFPKDIQDAIDSVAGENGSVRYGRDVYDKARADLDSIVTKNGYKLNPYTVPADEIAKWLEIAGKPVYANWLKAMKAKGFTSSQDILDALPKLVAQYNK